MGIEYALSRPLESPLPRLPSTPSFEWMKLISIIFIIPLEYGLLETDGQLIALCGVKSKRKMVSGWSCPTRFNMVAYSKFKCTGWCKA